MHKWAWNPEIWHRRSETEAGNSESMFYSAWYSYTFKACTFSCHIRGFWFCSLNLQRFRLFPGCKYVYTERNNSLPSIRYSALSLSIKWGAKVNFSWHWVVGDGGAWQTDMCVRAHKGTRTYFTPRISLVTNLLGYLPSGPKVPGETHNEKMKPPHRELPTSAELMAPTTHRDKWRLMRRLCQEKEEVPRLRVRPSSIMQRQSLCSTGFMWSHSRSNSHDFEKFVWKGLFSMVLQFEKE